mgnify:CR=1 FL=1|tara:strand:- start:379 stop:699 length:321 start_codon:yes stop_codon:yes gene_type:complete
MKTFQQFIGEAYPRAERKSHSPPRTNFKDALDKQRMDAGRMAPMPQIGAGKGVPLYTSDYRGPQRENDRTPGSFGKQTNKSKVTKRYYTNFPIQTGEYKQPDNITL